MLRNLLAGTAVALLTAPGLAQQQSEDPNGTTTTPIQEQTEAQDEQAEPGQPETEQQATEEQPLDAEPADPQLTEEQPPETEAAEQQVGVAPQETFIPAQEEGLLLATDLMNVNVVDAQDESIGGIDDLILDPEGGIFGAVVSVGGFLGIGAKQVALSWNEFRYSPEEQTAYLNVTREQLEEAPDFQSLADIRREEEAALTEQEAQQPMEQPVPPAQQQ